MARSRPVILDDDDPPPRHSEVREQSRDGFEWGLASSLIGATLLILAPLVVLLVMASSRSSLDDYSSHSDMTKLEILSYLGVIGAIIFCIVGFMFGRHGMSRSRAERTSAALPVSGMLLNLAAVFVWLLSAFVVLGRGASW